MRRVFAVYKRELNLFFRSNIAYAVAFGLLLFLGVLYSSSVSTFSAVNQGGFSQQVFTADDILLTNISTLTFLLFIIAPLLTMRLLSEETREGTLEVLMTLPMSDWHFVVGKFLAVWTLYTVILLLTLLHAFLLTLVGTLDMGLLFTAYLGAWLYGGATLAVALIWSALTEDQIVAAFLGAASILVLLLAERVAELVASQPAISGAADFVRELSFPAHYDQTMLGGIIRAEDVLYFVLLMIAALFITTLLVSSRRWRAS
ncbi:MAG: ABC transporter permease [Aggregatilineales bacterium]